MKSAPRRNIRAIDYEICGDEKIRILLECGHVVQVSPAFRLNHCLTLFCQDCKEVQKPAAL